MYVRNLEIIRRITQVCAIMASIGLPIGIFISFFIPVGYTHHEEVIGTITHYWSEPILRGEQGIFFIVLLVGILAANGSIKRYYKKRVVEEQEGKSQKQGLSRDQIIPSQVEIQSISGAGSQVQTIVKGMKFCSACGERIKTVAQFCEFCGNPQK